MDACDVFFFETFSEEEPSLRRHLPPHIRAVFTPSTVQGSGLAQPPSRLVSIRTQSRLPTAWLDSLDAVLTRSTGFDHLLPMRRAGSDRPLLGALPEYCSSSVAEHAMLLWTALLHRLPRQQRQFTSFVRDGITGREVRGRTVAIFGVGRIGHDIARLASALGMRVLGVDIVKRHPDVYYASREQALAEADIIACAMNLTPENAGYFDMATLALAKPGCVFINVSRGELSPTAPLLAMLEAGHLGGVALDVFDHESQVAAELQGGIKPSPGSESDLLLRLAARDDVLLTPHNAFNTLDAVERKSEFTALQVVTFLDTGTFRWPL